MSRSTFSDERLLAYADEMLPVDQMASVEEQLRTSQELQRRLAALLRRRDHGEHSVGEIWRRERLSCPNRSQLGSYLLGTLESDLADYVEFHLQAVGCRLCAANVRDLRESHDATPETRQRRRKFFETSAGYLRRRDG